VWEGRADASRFFFPPDDFDPSPAPAMLSCTALDTAEATGLPRLSPGGILPESPYAAAGQHRRPQDAADQAASSCCPPGAGGGTSDSKKKHGGIEHAGESVRKGAQEEKTDGVTSKVASVAAAGISGERRHQHGIRGGKPGTDCGGSRQSKSGKTAAGISLLRPYVIDLKREVN